MLSELKPYIDSRHNLINKSWLLRKYSHLNFEDYLDFTYYINKDDDGYLDLCIDCGVFDIKGKVEDMQMNLDGVVLVKLQDINCVYLLKFSNHTF
jgi:hypothetical protein